MSIYFQEMWQLAMAGQTQGVWFWAALYTLLICVYSLIFQLRTRTWPSVPGQLFSVKIEKFGATPRIISDQNYASKALYSYCVDGITYEGKRVSPWVFVASHNAKFVLQKQMSAIQTLPNEQVKVFYKPSNPQKSYLIVAGYPGIAITLLISILPFTGFYCEYYL